MKNSTGVMVLVSEQVLPALQAIWHAGGKDLRQIILLYTDDKGRSGNPAKQIEKICKDSLREVPIERVPTFVGKRKGITPEEVTQAILGVKATFPHIDHWIINASGGLKTMTIGVSNVLPDGKNGEESDFSIVYRELNGDWFSLYREGTQIHSRQLDKPAPNLLKDVSVKDLVTAQFSDERAFLEPKSLEYAKIDILQKNLIEVTKSLIQTKWQWVEVFNAFSLCEKGTNAGFCFEKYITACLCEMGITNLTWSLETKLQTEGNLQVFQEHDIVINHNDQIYFLDLKLRSHLEDSDTSTNKNKETRDDELKEESINKQVLKADATMKKSGGLSARWVMIRPCRTLSKAEHEIVKIQRNIQVLDQESAQELLPLLASEKMFNVPLTPKLEEIATLLRADATPFQSQLVGRSSRPPKVMRSFGKHELSEAGQNWWLADLECLFVFRVTKNATGEQKIQEGQEWLAFLKACGITKLTEQHSTNQWRFIWGGSAPQALQATLLPFVGKQISLKEGALQELPIADVVAPEAS
jgi:hypothetical protein